MRMTPAPRVAAIADWEIGAAHDTYPIQLPAQELLGGPRSDSCSER